MRVTALILGYGCRDWQFQIAIARLSGIGGDREGA